MLKGRPYEPEIEAARTFVILDCPDIRGKRLAIVNLVERMVKCGLR